jgi:hypothetical protein
LGLWRCHADSDLIRQTFATYMRSILLALFFVFAAQQMEAQTRERLQSFAGRQFFVEDPEGNFRLKNEISGDSSITENPRAVAIILDVTLGLLGMHRLYLGTDLKVPILYTLTFGGGGVLWLADLGLLIFTKDITPYMNNPNVFMWTINEKTKR